MNVRYSPLVVLGFACLAFTSDGPVEQDSFSWTPKVGDQAQYTFSHTVDEFKVSLTGDLDVTVTKIPSPDKAELKFHMSNVTGKTAPGTTSDYKVAGDRTVQTGAQGLPVEYTPSQNSTDYIFLMYGWAASTTDKPAKVGDETPWKTTTKMGQGTLVLDGTIKVVEVSEADKRMKAQITAKIIVEGKEAGTYTNTSTFSLPDYGLIESVADFYVGTKQEIKFTRKP
jgi:hypothetical protein